MTSIDSVLAECDERERMLLDLEAIMMASLCAMWGISFFAIAHLSLIAIGEFRDWSVPLLRLPDGIDIFILSASVGAVFACVEVVARELAKHIATGESRVIAAIKKVIDIVRLIAIAISDTFWDIVSREYGPLGRAISAFVAFAVIGIFMFAGYVAVYGWPAF